MDRAKKQKKDQTVFDLKKSGADYNPRIITRGELKRLEKAIQELGDLGGIVKNIQTGNIISGHQRIKVIPPEAIIQKEIFSVPSRTGTVAQGYIIVSGERFSYREVDWDSEREKMANIAANAHGGDWDEEKLGQLLKELAKEPDFDLDIVGFDLADLNQILGENLQEIVAESTADKLMALSNQLREARAVFHEVQKKMKEVDDVMDCYLVVIFWNSAERKRFTDLLGLPDNRYVDGRVLQTGLIAPSSEKI